MPWNGSSRPFLNESIHPSMIPLEYHDCGTQHSAQNKASRKICDDQRTFLWQLNKINQEQAYQGIQPKASLWCRHFPIRNVTQDNGIANFLSGKSSDKSHVLSEAATVFCVHRLTSYTIGAWRIRAQSGSQAPESAIQWRWPKVTFVFHFTTSWH